MFNVDQLRLQIEAVLREFPDLADDELLRADMLESETDFKEVLAELFKLANEIRKMIKVQTEEIQDYSARRARFGRQVEFYRALMLKILQSAELRKVILPQVTLSQVKGTQQIIGDVAVEDLPDDLCRFKREPDVAKIREALENGREVSGLALSNAEPNLAMRPK